MSKLQDLVDREVIEKDRARPQPMAHADQQIVSVRGARQVVASEAQMARRLEDLLARHPGHPKAAGWKAKLAVLKG